jgi:uncharacterized protein (TIGR02145 family)
MKKLICLLVVIVITTTQSQPILRIWKGGVKLDSVAVTNDLKITFGTGSGDFSCGSQIIYSGKTYNTVLIGSQCWLRENLDVGVFVQSINTDSNHSDVSNNGIIEKYCYNNDTLNCNTYGGLYDWNEAMQYVPTPGAQGICPDGWHIPTLSEFETLKATVNNYGNALKAVGQGSGAGAGTNSSGFSALLAGSRSVIGSFFNLDTFAFFWGSAEHDVSEANGLFLTSNSSGIVYYGSNKNVGCSVRCVKD